MFWDMLFDVLGFLSFAWFKFKISLEILNLNQGDLKLEP